MNLFQELNLLQKSEPTDDQSVRQADASTVTSVKFEPQKIARPLNNLSLLNLVQDKTLPVEAALHTLVESLLHEVLQGVPQDIPG